uniref:diaminopimelate decarboxylase n=1 Tax=Peterkaempfera griseoplana TaxID=66896 RepID=UPI00099F022A
MTATTHIPPQSAGLPPQPSPVRPTGPAGPGDPLGPPWPASAAAAEGPGELLVGGVPLSALAERFGTPLYVLDEDEVRRRCRAYRQALPDAEILYAAKAFLSTSMADWVAEEGLGLDVCSGGELHLAVLAGFPAERILLHGNAKTPEELAAAVRLGVGRIVIDNLSEIPRLAALTSSRAPQAVMVRVVPGVAAGHHPAVRTGVDGQKFGFPVAGGAAEEAVRRILDQPGLRLTGLHCHLGSQISSVEPYLEAVDRMTELAARIHARFGAPVDELDLGGGHAVPYLADEPGLDLADFAARVPARLARQCRRLGLRPPRLLLEPGRAVAGPSAVALYRVLSVKRSTGGRMHVAVDGGMGDNPRPSLYGSAYTARLVGRSSSAAPRLVDVVGRHCEAGDILVHDVPLPSDIRAGDLLAVPTAGAYQLSMASGYNLVGRPALAAVRGGRARLLMRRETVEDFRLREVGR